MTSEEELFLWVYICKKNCFHRQFVNSQLLNASAKILAGFFSPVILSHILELCIW